MVSNSKTSEGSILREENRFKPRVLLPSYCSVYYNVEARAGQGTVIKSDKVNFLLSLVWLCVLNTFAKSDFLAHTLSAHEACDCSHSAKFFSV